MKRPLYINIWDELSEKKSMIFLAGPRQSGKTTLAKQILEFNPNHILTNWDFGSDREKILKHPTFFEDIVRHDKSKPLIIFDEIHKYKKWKNYLKGIYDRFSDEYRFLILGSGRLDVFKKGGDSLAGRYFLFHVFPFTLAEIVNNRRPVEEFLKDPLALHHLDSHQKEWLSLEKLSGFPEPFLSGSEQTYQLWSRTYRQQLIYEDIRNLTEIKSIDLVDVLYSLLPSKVGALLSIDSLCRDLQTSHKSVSLWIQSFEYLYLVFRISPWSKKISRTLLKGQKLYLYDATRIDDEGNRFENMVAIELLRAVTYWNDLGYGEFALNYLRNKEQEEVDFLIVKNGKPFLLIEAKLSDETPPKSLLKFQSVLNIPAVQLVKNMKGFKILHNQQQKILVTEATQWLCGL